METHIILAVEAVLGIGLVWTIVFVLRILDENAQTRWQVRDQINSLENKTARQHETINDRLTSVFDLAKAESDGRAKAERLLSERIVALENVQAEPKRKQVPPISAPRWSESRDELEGKPPRGHSKPKLQETQS